MVPLQTLLRAKALECISLVGMAVGKDRFRKDAHEVMGFMKAFNDQVMTFACFYVGTRLMSYMCVWHATSAM